MTKSCNVSMCNVNNIKKFESAMVIWLLNWLLSVVIVRYCHA